MQRKFPRFAQSSFSSVSLYYLLYSFAGGHVWSDGTLIPTCLRRGPRVCFRNREYTLAAASQWHSTARAMNLILAPSTPSTRQVLEVWSETQPGIESSLPHTLAQPAVPQGLCCNTNRKRMWLGKTCSQNFQKTFHLQLNHFNVEHQKLKNISSKVLSFFFSVVCLFQEHFRLEIYFMPKE